MSGVVAAGNPHTAECAAEVLRAGGNAVDAVIAAALGACVAEPLLASAGGAGMLTVALPGREPCVVDFFSDTPGREGRPSELDFVAVTVDFGSATQVFHVGRGSAAAPLALPGLAYAADAFASVPLADLVGPAARLARDGVPFTPETAEVFHLLWPIVAQSPATVAAYGVDGQPPAAGTLHKNEPFADVLDAFGREGAMPASFRSGLLEHFGKAGGGLLGPRDLEEVSLELRPPRRIALGDWEILTSPRLGGELLGVIVDALAATSPSEDVAQEMARFALASLAGHEAKNGRNELGSTTHISVIDGKGGAASATLTNGEGSGHLVPGTGIQMNNFLGEEDLNPNGFHAERPGSPLPSMIAPTIALQRGEPVLALGSGGANRIRSVVSQVLYRVAVLGQDLESAVLAPRAHAEDDTAWVELQDLADPGAAVSALRESFQDVYPFPERAFFFGGVHAVQRRPDGALVGFGDTRRGGAVVSV